MELSEEQRAQLEEQKKHCPFCKIISGEIPSKKVYEDKRVLAILDINPLREGHVLVFPKEHYPILALLPEEDSKHLFGLLPDMAKQLRKAMLATRCSVFIANGAAAGKQAGHFMIHLIPSDSPISNFSPTRSEQDEKAYDELRGVLEHNVPIMIQKNAASYPLQEEETDPEISSSEQLAQLLEENREFKEMVMHKPEAVLAGLEDNPSLKPLFEGVDVHALSKKLLEQEAEKSTDEVAEQPADAPAEESSTDTSVRAVDMSDEQLVAFLNDKPRLLTYLQEDMAVLKEAISQQPKLQEFFSETSPEQVLARVQQTTNDASSLEELAGGGV